MEAIHIVLGITAVLAVFAGGLYKVMKEMAEAISSIKSFIKKYKHFFKEGEGKEDFKKMTKEVDEALEATADFLDKLQLRKQAKILRGAIK